MVEGAEPACSASDGLAAVKVAKRIVDKIHELGFTRNVASDVVESILEIMKRTLEDEEDVLISGFGKFCVRAHHIRRERAECRNKVIEIVGSAAAVRTVDFKNTNNVFQFR